MVWNCGDGVDGAGPDVARRLGWAARQSQVEVSLRWELDQSDACACASEHLSRALFCHWYGPTIACSKMMPCASRNSTSGFSCCEARFFAFVRSLTLLLLLLLLLLELLLLPIVRVDTVHSLRAHHLHVPVVLLLQLGLLEHAHLVLVLAGASGVRGCVRRMLKPEHASVALLRVRRRYEWERRVGERAHAKLTSDCGRWRLVLCYR